MLCSRAIQGAGPARSQCALGAHSLRTVHEAESAASLVFPQLKGNWHEGTALGEKTAAEALQQRLSAAAGAWLKRRGIQHPDQTFFVRDSA